MQIVVDTVGRAVAHFSDKIVINAPGIRRGAFFVSGGDHTHKASSRYTERPPVLKNRASQCFNTDQPLTVSTSQKGRMAMTIIRKQYIRRKCDPVEAERIWSERGGVKACTKCGHTKRRDQFKPVTKAKDGAAPDCKDCRNKHERTKRAPLVKYSAPRKKVQPSDYGEIIWRSIEISNAHDAWAWWLDNAPAWWVEARSRWRREMQLGWWLAATHRRRAKARGGEVGDVDGRAMTALMTKATCCYWCNCTLTRYGGGAYQPTDATYDHIVSLSDGGGHTIENLTISCAKCNFGRDSRDWKGGVAA